MLIRVAMLALAAIGALALGPTVAAGQTSREIDVRPGFDGLGKSGRWLPVRVTVANDGPGLSGDLRLVTRLPGGAATVAYGQTVELPTRSRKQVRLSAPVTGLAGDLSVELVVEGQQIAAREVPVRLLSPGEFVIGVLADDEVPPAGLGSLRRGGGQVSVARVRPDDIPPDPEDLQVLDALVVRNVSTGRLGADQRAALRAWVESGGQLVVAGGPGWRRTVDGLEDLLPVEGLWSRQLKYLRAFGRYGGSQPGDGDVLVTVGSPIEGARVLLAQDSIPLVVERWLGQGRVTFLAADPALEPFRSWPAAEGVWQRILVGGRTLFPATDEPLAGSLELPLRSALAAEVDLGLPSWVWLASFLVAYLAAVGPGQYVVLRRLDRREWAWFGFPLLAFAFTGLAYVGGVWLRGPESRLGTIAVLRSVPGARTAVQDVFLGLVAPIRGNYDVELVDLARPRLMFGRGALASDRAEIRVGPPSRLPGLRLEGRTLQALQSRSFAPAATPVQAMLRTTTGRLEGLVKNGGPDLLEDALVVAGGEVLALGDIPPGESRPVSVALPTSRATGGGPVLLPGGAWPDGSTGSSERRQFVQSLLAAGRGLDGESAGGATLIAWASATPPRATANGKAVAGSASRLIEQALPIDYGVESVVVPPGLIGRTLLDGAAIQRGVLPSFTVRGPIVFQFNVPPEISLSRVDRLSLHLAQGARAAYAPSGASAPGGFGIRASVFRWADRTWVDVPIDSSGVGDVAFGAQFIDGDAIRVRLEPTVPEVAVQQLDVSLEGAR